MTELTGNEREEYYEALRKIRDIGAEIQSWQYGRNIACSKVLMKIDHILDGRAP